jgi:pyruvate dehydrogenase E1 component alpha subunit
MIKRRCAPLCVPIATHALHAVGLAMGARMDGSTDLAVAYIGDGATSEGDAHEAFNFAAVFDAPCIFFVQNNHWAISVPLRAQTRAISLAHKAIAYGMPGVRCDGNDVIATWAVTREAASRAKAGAGPTLIEAVTYRMGGHSTSDDPLRYRDPAEVAEWETRDPIKRVRLFLEREHWWTAERADEVTERSASACAQLRAGIYDAPPPAVDELFDHVYVAKTAELERQAAKLRTELGDRG